ncbi:hypothetical protein HHX47_DHR4000561 [Lentinula edodes]|nr:hypothetical protein HHX47_DHR4000561 [Lentinula edodes]
MFNVSGTSRPAWQTEELEDEWIEAEAEGGEYEDEDQFNGTRSISFTAPLSTQIHTITNTSSPVSSPEPMGTFLVHQSIPSVPLLPKTPGRNKKANIKDFFSPMPLERMFEPPSPPQPSSPQRPPRSPGEDKIDEIMETDIPNMVSFDGRKPSVGCQFTFSAPRDVFLNLDNRPQAESTPGNPTVRTTNAPPSTDPPLRLFQFQYDTYTRDHLSAMVDSIAINPALGSGATNSPASLDQGLSRVSEATGISSLNSHLRSAKRVKLSPKSDFLGNGNSPRPKLLGKDYVGESRSLMQQIKQARDFSTISTVASAQERDTSDMDPIISPASSAPVAAGVRSSTKFRLQAATLMAQIKNDMKGSKRIFSGNSESYVTAAESTAPNLPRQSPRRSKPRLNPNLRKSTIRREEDDLAPHFSQISISSCRPQDIPQLPHIRISSESSMHDMAPSAPSSSSSRLSPLDNDLKRYVSSSTTSSGTTLTTSSVPSYVKHSGPAHIRTIAPSEVPPLDRLGNMMFDRVMMKWVKSSAPLDEDHSLLEEISEDPFGDIESLKDDSGPTVEDSTAALEEHVDLNHSELSLVEELSEIDDTEEMELTSFETDHPNSRLVHAMSDFITNDGAETSDSENDTVAHEPFNPIEYDSECEEDEQTNEQSRAQDDKEEDDDANGLIIAAPSMIPAISRSPGTPDRPISSPSSMRSAMKTPASVLKDVSVARYRTPQRKSKHRRSVSFSDGKRDGPIRGLNKNAEFDDVPGGSRIGFVPSVRSRRIANMLVALEDSVEYQVRYGHFLLLAIGLTSYHHLLNLENLDISKNEVESLSQLSCLRHLRELKADWNKISNLEGLEHMDGLVKLSVQGNRIRSIDILQYQWTRLEMLNISENRLDHLIGLASLPSLIALNVDNNSLEMLIFDSPMPRLKILRASGNRLSALDTSFTSNLRTLYVDNNSLTGLTKVDRLTKLENLSLRNQSGKGCKFSTRDTRDVKRLYLSGIALGGKRFLTESCYNLVYLELAACRLTSMPESLASLIPNVRVLNLNYNFLEDAKPLEGLTRLQKLTMIGSRLKGTKALIRLLQRMPEVEMLDFRMNPCTLGWYLPLLVKDVPGALQPSEDGRKGDKAASKSAWQDLDAKFRRGLPNDSYIGRLAYRGLVMQACQRIRMLDGIEVTEKERSKAEKLLEPMIDDPKSLGNELNSYNVAQLQFALPTDLDYDSRRMSSSGTSTADTDSSIVSRAEKRPMTPSDSPEPKKSRPALDVDPSNWEIKSEDAKVQLPSIFTTFEDDNTLRPPANEFRRASLPTLTSDRIRHSPYPPPSLRQSYAPTTQSSLAAYTFPPSNPADDDKNRSKVSTDLSYSITAGYDSYPTPGLSTSSNYGSPSDFNPGAYPDADSNWHSSPSGIVRPNSTPGQLSAPAVKYDESLRHASFSAPTQAHMFAGSARISGHQDRRSFSAGIKTEWNFPNPDFLPPSVPQYTSPQMPPAPSSASRPSQSVSTSTLVDRPQRKRGKLPKETTDFLKAWLHRHSDHPYPSEEEKKQLCHATGLSMSQVSNWMINVSDTDLPLIN